MSERSLWNTIREHLRHYDIDVQRHEDKLSKGIPDLSFGYSGRNGWIELKYIDKVRNEEELLLCPNFTGSQRRWLLNRGAKGGGCFFLLQVGREYLLFDHLGCQFVGRVSLSGLREHALRQWRGRIDFPDLLDALREPLA